MKVATVAQMTVRVSGALQILGGALIWTGRFDQLIPFHKFFGIVLVLALWTLAFQAARGGLPIGMVVAAFALGLIAPVLGLTQEAILSNGLHWVVQVVHLLIGLMAIGISENMGRQLKARAPAPVRAA